MEDRQGNGWNHAPRLAGGFKQIRAGTADVGGSQASKGRDRQARVELFACRTDPLVIGLHQLALCHDIRAFAQQIRGEFAFGG
ncbi:hypothetical protein D3C80_1702890 [compost metagenome]